MAEEYEENSYELESSSNGRDKWNQDKASVGLDFPNLPYLIDGDVQLTQSNAIMRYLARKHGLDGKTDAERTRIDLTDLQIQDYWMDMIMPVYAADSTAETLEQLRQTTVKDQLDKVSKFLGDRPFFSGDSVSYVDFKAFEYLSVASLFAPEALAPHSNLLAFLKRIELLPNIAKYIASPNFRAWPVTGPMAKWGNDNSTPELNPRRK